MSSLIGVGVADEVLAVADAVGLQRQRPHRDSTPN
jgi:hypothetical protein